MNLRLICSLSLAAGTLLGALNADPAAAQTLEESIFTRWKMDAAATKKLGGELTPDQVDDIAQLDLSFEFERDGGLKVHSVDPAVQDGKWSKLRVDEPGKEVEFEISCAGTKGRMKFSRGKTGLTAVYSEGGISLAFRPTAKCK